MTMIPMSIATIATIAANGQLAKQTLAWLDVAGYEIQFARDPQTLGSEPHLRVDVDACGLNDDALQVLDQAIFTEIAAREELRADRFPGDAMLPLAA